MLGEVFVVLYRRRAGRNGLETSKVGAGAASDKKPGARKGTHPKSALTDTVEEWHRVLEGLSIEFSRLPLFLFIFVLLSMLHRRCAASTLSRATLQDP